MRELVILGERQRNYQAVESSPEAECFITSNHFEALEALTLKRVQAAAPQNLQQIPNLQRVLDTWQEQTTQAEVKQWLQKVGNEEAS